MEINEHIMSFYYKITKIETETSLLALFLKKYPKTNTVGLRRKV